MKTTILIGYKKTDASGNPLGAGEVISGPPENEKARQTQAKVFAAAKGDQDFPKGIRAVEFCVVEVAERAAKVTPEKEEF